MKLVVYLTTYEGGVKEEKFCCDRIFSSNTLGAIQLIVTVNNEDSYWRIPLNSDVHVLPNDAGIDIYTTIDKLEADWIRKDWN